MIPVWQLSDFHRTVRSAREQSCRRVHLQLRDTLTDVLEETRTSVFGRERVHQLMGGQIPNLKNTRLKKCVHHNDQQCSDRFYFDVSVCCSGAIKLLVRVDGHAFKTRIMTQVTVFYRTTSAADIKYAYVTFSPAGDYHLMLWSESDTRRPLFVTHKC